MATNPVTPGLTPSQLNAAGSAQWKEIIKQSLNDVRVATPAFLVEDLNATKQTVTVQIAIQERVRTPRGQQWWDIPPITNVPIVLPRGGGFALTLPLKKDDEGLLVFCDTCFDNWWANGTFNAPPAYANATTQVTSGSQRQLEVRRHHVHDCGFIPGMWSQPNVLSAYATDAAQLRSDDQSASVSVSSGKAALAANAEIDLKAPSVVITDGSGGMAQGLMTTAWQTWFTTNVLPHINTGVIPVQPSETTVLKGQ